MFSKVYEDVEKAQEELQSLQTCENDEERQHLELAKLYLQAALRRVLIALGESPVGPVPTGAYVLEDSPLAGPASWCNELFSPECEYCIQFYQRPDQAERCLYPHPCDLEGRPKFPREHREGP